MASHLALFIRHFRPTSIALALCLAPVLAAQADSWLPPENRTYLSDDATFKLTVIPKDIGSALEYFDRKVANDPTLETGYLPVGILERSDAHGGWTELWHSQLVNEVSPVSALISERGDYVATFDNWHSMGWGDDVIAVYGKDGSVLYTYSLTDLIPDYYLLSLPRTVSSLNWSCRSDSVPERNHRFSKDGETLIISFKVPGKDASSKADCVDLAISLDDGTVAKENPTFQSVLPGVREIFEIQDQRRRDRDAAFRAPLFPPDVPDRNSLRSYLIEAFYRLDSEWMDRYPNVQLMTREDHPDHSQDMSYLRSKLVSENVWPSTIMVGSLDGPEHILDGLDAATADLPTKGLSDWKIYVLAPPELEARLVDIIEPLGAEFVLLDPTIGIPQRQERLENRFGRAEVAE